MVAFAQSACLVLALCAHGTWAQLAPAPAPESAVVIPTPTSAPTPEPVMTDSMRMLPGLQQVPAAQLPPRVPGNTSMTGNRLQPLPPQPDCTVPQVPREGFSASQVAYLVAELQEVITPGCYSVVSTSLAVCLPDLSLSSGCCTPGCARSLRLAVSPECLAQFWHYICSNNTYYASYVGGVFDRCLPATAFDLALTCPVNDTLLTRLVSRGNLPGGLGLRGPNQTQQGAASGGESGDSAAASRDVQYMAGCVQDEPLLWPDFNGSLIFDSLLAFAQDVPQDCLRTSLAYLPSCYDDLTYHSGCCSLRCRAAVEKVPIPCFVAFLRSLCVRIPTSTKFFFNAAVRCANLSLSCQVFGPPTRASNILSNAAANPRSLPLVASNTGQCPLSATTWPGYNAITVTSATLRLLADASAVCRPQIARISSSCHYELAVQQGCCSYQCALVMRSVPDNCHHEFQKLLCRQPDIAKYSVALAARCLGGGELDPGNYACEGQQQPPQQAVDNTTISALLG